MTRRSSRKRFLTLDCETDPFRGRIIDAVTGAIIQEERVPQPFIWGMYDGASEDYWEFATADDVVKFLEDKDYLIYAHNGGKFDYHYMRDSINSDDAVMVIAGRIAKFKIGDCEFRDSMNILVNPLRAFAKEEIDYTKLEPDVRHLHMDEIKRYLKSDCVNLWNTINAYFTRYGSALTQAGSSMRYWRKHYKVPMTPQTAQQSVLYRDYYYGGRVQCFESGHKKERFEVCDFNSAYPFAMLSKHPISPIARVDDHLPPGDEMTRCLVRLTGTAKGCFPIRGDDNSLYFPDDERTIREYFVTGWELKAALETDSLTNINIKQVHYFTQTVDFADYITHFYNERKAAKKAGDTAQSNFAKLFMNSLYGKFAADCEKYREYLIASDDTLEKWTSKKEGYTRLQPWGDRWLMARPLPESKHRYYNVATAASITGFVRAHLFKALHKCTGLIYCDTDSIAARSLHGISYGTNLGDVKLEMIGSEWAIAGKKSYAFLKEEDFYQQELCQNKDAERWKVASKGVRLTPEQIIRVANGEHITFDPEVPTYSLRRSEPIFVHREIKNTAKDIRKL